MSSVPTTWPELGVRFQARNAEEPRSLATAAVERMKTCIPQTPMGRHFMGLGEVMSRIAILVGPQVCRPIIAAHAPFYAVACEQAAQAGAEGGSPLIQVALLSYGNVAYCIGDSPLLSSVDEQAMVERAIQGKEDFDDFEDEGLAAACIAVGLPERAIAVLRHKAPPPFKPGQKFGPNLAGLLDYLCAGLKIGASEQDVLPAWESMHAMFPRNLAAKTVRWSTLLWIARTVFGRIGGRPAAEIIGEVHALSTRP